MLGRGRNWCKQSRDPPLILCGFSREWLLGEGTGSAF